VSAITGEFQERYYGFSDQGRCGAGKAKAQGSTSCSGRLTDFVGDAAQVIFLSAFYADHVTESACELNDG